MKQLLFLIGAFLLLKNQVSAQTPGDVPVAKPVAQGVWVFLGKTIPRHMTYQIERKKAGSDNYEKLGITTAPSSRREMEQRQTQLHQYFEALDPLTDQEISRLWDYIEKHHVTDSMYCDNVPMMHLMAGTAFFDKKAEAGGNYTYRITLSGSGNSVTSQKESNPTSLLKETTFPKLKFISKDYADGKLSVVWSVSAPLAMSHFNIYRSVFGKDDYRKLNAAHIQKGIYSENDSLRLLMTDTIGKQPAWFEYLVAPVDAFGNEGTKQAITDGGNIDNYYAPPISQLTALSTAQGHEVKLSWRIENKKYLNGVTIMRSSNYDSGYQRVVTLPVSDTSFTDIVPETGENFYYYLIINSANDTPVNSAKVFVAYTGDSGIPARPSPVDALTIPNGIKVYWQDNNSYTKGFFVYRRSNTTEDFVQASPMVPAGDSVYSFTDTSGILRGGEVYQYIVRTMNEGGQLSQNSDTVTTYPGIKASLMAPMNLRYHLDKNIVTLIWDDMTLWEENLSGYKVYRKMGDGIWEPLKNDSLRAKKNFYSDTLVRATDRYSYAVRTWDFFGNESETSEIRLPARGEVLNPPPPGITLRQSTNHVYISWGQMSREYSAVKIYRSEPGQPDQLIGTVKEDDFYEDKNVAAGKLYLYRLSIVDNTNQEGVLSEKLSLRMR